MYSVAYIMYMYVCMYVRDALMLVMTGMFVTHGFKLNGITLFRSFVLLLLLCSLVHMPPTHPPLPSSRALPGCVIYDGKGILTGEVGGGGDMESALESV